MGFWHLKMSHNGMVNLEDCGFMENATYFPFRN
jgi:hypothetical protein